MPSYQPIWTKPWILERFQVQPHISYPLLVSLVLWGCATLNLVIGQRKTMLEMSMSFFLLVHQVNLGLKKNNENYLKSSS